MKHILTTALLAGTLAAFAGCNDDEGGKSKNYPAQIPATERFPVVAWHGVRSSHGTVERFQEAEQMGITLNYSRMGNVETALKCLDNAAKTNVKLIVECNELYVDSERRDAVRRLMNHPALAGYFMDDEPAPDKFEGIGKRIDEISRMDKNHICYCNIFPTMPAEVYTQWGFPGVTDYRSYVDTYLSTCKPTFLSFDQYPIVQSDNKLWIQDTWYPTLETASAEAKRNRLDLWAFMLTVPHTSYPQPTLDHLRLQAYSDLAYGAQVLQCFTYWTPTVADPELWNYRDAPIAEDGTRTPTYDIVKAMLDEVQQVAWIFRGGKMQGVWHLGKNIPQGTKALTTMPEGVESMSIGDSETALVSVLTNHDFTFMVFQNTSINDKCRSSIRMKEGVRRVLRDGSVIPASEEEAVQVLDPGDVRIYMW